MLLAEHVIEELRELGGEEIARPLGGDRLERDYGAQVVVSVPERERAMQRALPPVHRQRFARTEMGAGGLAGALGLAIKPECRGVELNDRRLRPALCSVDNGFDALIEAQQTRGKVVRRRDSSRVIGGQIEAAGVFHAPLLVCGGFRFKAAPLQMPPKGSSAPRSTRAAA
jgi:hypothetical protein